MVTKHKDRAHHVNLLYLTEKEGNTHYCLVKDLSRLSHLMSHLTKHKESSYFCNYCLKRFRSRHILSVHNCNPPEIPKLPLTTPNQPTFPHLKTYQSIQKELLIFETNRTMCASYGL